MKKELHALYYPETICLDETELKLLLLLYDKVSFFPPDTHLNPGQTTLSMRFSAYDAIITGAYRSKRDAYYAIMYASEQNVWDDTLKRLMDTYDELESMKIVGALQEDKFGDISQWHPLKVAVDADMQDDQFVSLCNTYRNKKIYIPPIEGSKIKGGGFAMRPMVYKKDRGIASICSERLNAALYFSGEHNLFPVCGQPMYVDLLKAKLRRCALTPPAYTTPPNSSHKFSMLSWEVATEIIPRDLIERKSAKNILRYKEACSDLKERFRSYMWRLEATTSAQPWDKKFAAEMDSLVKKEIIPEVQRIRDKKIEIWEKLFGDTLKMAVPAVVGINLVLGLSFWNILATSSGAMLKPLVESWYKERKAKRNALFFLVKLAK